MEQACDVISASRELKLVVVSWNRCDMVSLIDQSESSSTHWVTDILYHPKNIFHLPSNYFFRYFYFTPLDTKIIYRFNFSCFVMKAQSNSISNTAVINQSINQSINQPINILLDIDTSMSIASVSVATKQHHDYYHSSTQSMCLSAGPYSTVVTSDLTLLLCWLPPRSRQHTIVGGGVILQTYWLYDHRG